MLLFIEHANILTASSHGCPENARRCEAFSCPKTCYCSDHCSWEKCTLSRPPENCLRGTNGTWLWNARWWSAKNKGEFKITCNYPFTPNYECKKIYDMLSLGYFYFPGEIDATNTSSNIPYDTKEELKITIRKPERVASLKMKGNFSHSLFLNNMVK